MKSVKYSKLVSLFFCTGVLVTSCTKLDQSLNSSLTNSQAANSLGANGTQLLLQTAYNDIGNPYSDLGNIFTLEEVTADQALVPTRGSDWDDGGIFRVLHRHEFKADGVGNIINQFNNLNKINFDATNVLAFNPTKVQAAEARFLRAFALYQLLDLFGQFPFRNPGDNLLNAPEVLSGEEAFQFIVSELTDIMPDLNASTNAATDEMGKTKANKDAANFLLMRLYLNHGAFVNRANPSFADADMQKVITLGNDIINSGRYGYNAKFFDNFNPTNSKSPEGIFAYPNYSGVTTNNSDIRSYWWSPLHYNHVPSNFANPVSGWNGFSTVAEFYNSFGVNTPATQTPADTLLDQRIGGRFYPNCTEIAGIRPGLLIGQQYNQNGGKYKDRKGNDLVYLPTIAADLKETNNATLERTGIRIVKYPPDYTGGAPYPNYGERKAGNWVMLFRYSEVVLMVAEAKMRAATPDNVGALALVNELRAVRGASPMAAPLVLVNPANIYDPKTFLAERGRELYWEAVRRTDLIRFGMFLKPFAYKTTTSDPKYLVFPIPTPALAANPNLVQNPGY
ncbi:MAG TPA: RagB/SusD family nutrient uptake outer membrane protein [Chitinophagaceae bacterium]|nr:RagB/SusD family nutrient uptake outer membrane protein [Chitinophagaceae bacterium]